LVIVLLVLLSLFFGHCVVCPSVPLLLVIVLFVLLLFTTSNYDFYLRLLITPSKRSKAYNNFHVNSLWKRLIRFFF
jgi:hypothetical protein